MGVVQDLVPLLAVAFAWYAVWYLRKGDVEDVQALRDKWADGMRKLQEERQELQKDVDDIMRWSGEGERTWLQVQRALEAGVMLGLRRQKASEGLEEGFVIDVYVGDLVAPMRCEGKTLYEAVRRATLGYEEQEQA